MFSEILIGNESVVYFKSGDVYLFIYLFNFIYTWVKASGHKVNTKIT